MINLSRRDLAKSIGAAAAAAGLGNSATAAPGAAGAIGRPAKKSFPPGFVWGCATAAFQIEGSTKADGRGETNWDVFCRTPGKTKDGATGDPASDSYRRFREDTKALKELGCNAYRFSIAWARIFPQGRGAVNQKGVDHYNRVIDNLLENGIRPFVTMYHWDYPVALPGGWQNRDTAQAMADYAGFMAGKISDRVHDFMTTNEISIFTDHSHRTGAHAPGLKLPPREANQVRHHGVLAHGLALQAIRANARQGTRVGFAENTAPIVPIIDNPEHVAAARKAFREINAPITTAIMEGRYLDSYLAEAGGDAPRVGPSDMKTIGAPVDFVAFNLYTGVYVRAADNKAGYEILPEQPASPRMNHPWLVLRPEAGYWATRYFSELWQPQALYCSENGCSAPEAVSNGRVDDPDRVMYLRNYLTHFQRAVAEGYPLKGYFQWSLADNFEWADGYSDTTRMGIYRTDFTTQKRTPKLSAAWYAEITRQNAVV